MRNFVLAALLAVFNINQIAWADESWLVLQKASEAARELSYQGVFVYQMGSVSKSVQITHMNFGQGEYARMVVLDGSPREVLSQGSNAVIFNPKNEKVIIEKRRGQSMFPALLPANMDAIKASYQLKLGGFERIAGREAQIVFLEPKDKYRYGYRFWADKEFGLLLKAMSTNERNESMEQMAFSQVVMLNDQNMDWFQPKVDHRKPYVMEQEKTVTHAEAPTWTMGEVPEGYYKVDQVLRIVPGKHMPVTHMIFSDGLSSVSVFIEKLSKGVTAKSGHSAMGATNLYALANEGYQVVVVGEVPEATVTQFASAVNFKK
jgi:sigma-E factor negative regulatory protein RseB